MSAVFLAQHANLRVPRGAARQPVSRLLTRLLDSSVCAGCSSALIQTTKKIPARPRVLSTRWAQYDRGYGPPQQRRKMKKSNIL